MAPIVKLLSDCMSESSRVERRGDSSRLPLRMETAERARNH